MPIEVYYDPGNPPKDDDGYRWRVTDDEGVVIGVSKRTYIGRWEAVEAAKDQYPDQGIHEDG